MSSYERVVNDDGEVGYFIPDSANAVIRTQKEIERAKMFAAYPKKKRFHHGRSYFVSYNDAVGSIIKDLTLIESGALIKLLLQLKIKGEGRLLKGDRPLNKTEIARVIGRSRPATNDIIDKLMDIGVLETTTENRRTVYNINAKYHAMGGTIANELFTKVYTVKAKEIIDNLKLNEIGMLYKIIPFFHYSEYYLCVNSNSSEESVEYMGREGLAESIEHDVSTVTKLMTKLQSAGALLITGTRNEARYLIHPDLMFRQSEGTETEWTRAVRKLFDDHRKKSRK